MNFSKNYFRKLEQDYKYGFGGAIWNEIKRYGDYCRLEERTENARVVNAEKAHIEGLEELKKMAKEDGIM